MTTAGEAPARRSLVRRIRGRLRRALWWTEEFRVYRLPAGAARGLAPGDAPSALRVDDPEAPARYAPDNPWDPPERRFFEMAAERRGQGHRLFSLVESGRLVHYSWLDPAATTLKTDFGNRYDLPAGSALLYDDNTHSSARGRGLHKRSLRERAAFAASDPRTQWVYITVRADNAPSRRNIESVGFRHVTSCLRRRRLGLARLAWVDARG